MPKVSVILSSYNQEKYIAASIESVLNQTFTDFELLIFDDGSIDNSRNIIRSFDDARIKLFLHEKNIGAIPSYLECCKAAKGEFSALQHSDDIWESTKLEKQVDFLEKNPQYEVCFTQVKFIDERGELYDLPENHPYKNVFNLENRSRAEWINFLFWNSNCFCHPSMLIRNAPENFEMDSCLFQLPDYLRWLKFCLRKSPYILQEELIKFRLRRENQNSVSSLSVEKLIRNANENYFMAREFMTILRDEKFFLEIFPEAEEFLIGGKISAEFAFAQLCLKRNLPAFQKLAIEILFDLIHNDSKRNLIKNLYGYDEKIFIRDTGKFDVFGIKAQLPTLNCRLYLNFEDDSDSVAVENVSLIREGNIFSATFNFQSDRKIKKIRFSPDENAVISVKIIEITVNDEIIENYHSNAFQIVDGYFNFLTVTPLFEIDKDFSANKIHVEIFGAVKNDALANFEKICSQSCLEIQQLKNTIAAQIEELQAKDEEIQTLKKLQQEILNSNSWKVTEPLRTFGKMIKKL